MKTISDICLRVVDNGFELNYQEKITNPAMKGTYDNCSYKYRTLVFGEDDGQSAITKMMELKGVSDSLDNDDDDSSILRMPSNY